MKTKTIFTENYIILMEDKGDCYENYLEGDGIAYKKIKSQAPDLNLPALPDWSNSLDIEVLAKEYSVNRFNNSDNPRYFNENSCVIDFTQGFKKAQEIQKDKQFTIRDIKTAMEIAVKHYSHIWDKSDGEKIIYQIQQSKLPKSFVLSDEFSTFKENLKNGKWVY